MRADAWSDRLCLGLRSVSQPVGEFIHVSAVYLGLAVLTTLGLSLVLPSMRQQTQQLHEVVLTMFQTNEGEDVAVEAGPVTDWSMPLGMLGVPETGGGTRPVLPAPQAGSAAPVDEGLTFPKALAASMQDAPIPGVKPAQAHALRSYLGRKYKVATSVAGALVRTAFEVGRERKIDPQLILAVIAIESRYNPFAESAVGAQGLMQVMTRVHKDKLQASGGPASVFNPVVNIQVGTQILSDCIRRRGSLTGGLACYVGATSPSDGGYGARVLAERRRIALASGIPLGKH